MLTLERHLGEPDDMEMDALGGSTLMTYTLSWECGCTAKGSGQDYVCAPCAVHDASLRAVS